MLFGFDLKTVSASAQVMMAFIENDLFFAICEVSQVRRGRVKKIRRLESICKMCFQVCKNRGWNDCMSVLETQLDKIANCKADINDMVNGFDW